MIALLILLVLVSNTLAFGQTSLPPQAERGQVLFMDTTKDKGCATCHALGGKGTAVGPDLRGIARVSPRAIVMAINSTRTQYVQAVKPKTGETFPGIKPSQDPNATDYYDLSTWPPSLKKLTKEEIASTTDNATWKHPPGISKYSAEQLADIISYMRYAAFGDRKGVSPSEIE